MGSLKGPCTTSYRSSIDTIALNRFVFEKIALFCILSTDRQTDRLTNKQTNKQTSVSETIRKPPLVKAQTA